MSGISEAFGNDPSVSSAEQIGRLAKRFEDVASEMSKAKNEEGDRYANLKTESDRLAADLTVLKDKHDADAREAEVKAALDVAAEWKKALANVREPAKSIGSGYFAHDGYQRGDFIGGIAEARSRDASVQGQGKSRLDAINAQYQESWGKATLGTTDATGGWIIPNAIVDSIIKPATFKNPYRELMTVVPGVTSAAVDQPFRGATPSRALVIAAGQTKTNIDIAYNGYAVPMYTLAQIYDVGNQFLRTSRGAAETDVMQELATGFALGEAYYIREGSGSSEPFGYTSALNNAAPAYRSAFTASASTLAGSILTSIATAAGALAGRGRTPDGAVLSAAAYWQMASQGLDGTGFFYAPAAGPSAIRPGTLLSPWGIPVYPDASADQTGTAAVVDNLVVGEWKSLKVFFGESYRVDSSDVAGTRWDTNVTGFRGEEEMGFDARAGVYAGCLQMIQDVTP